MNAKEFKPNPADCKAICDSLKYQDIEAYVMGDVTSEELFIKVKKDHPLEYIDYSFFLNFLVDAMYNM
jgi:hypothetical protein